MSADTGGRLRRMWPRLRKGLWILVAAAVLALLAWRARTIDWREVLAAVRALPAISVVAAAAAAVAAHAAYVSYDLLARRYTRHPLGVGRTAAIAGTCFAFNLNFGALVGGVALRYRLYQHSGLRASTVTRILAFSMLTNWMGYAALAGVAFASGGVELPADAAVPPAALRAIGVALLLAAAGYVAACRWSRRRRWRVRGHTLVLPRARVALLQLAASILHWSLLGLAIHLLLQREVGYVTVLGALLLSAVATVVTHVPAGLGVIEAVFLWSLPDVVPESRVLAALLAYRAVFHLGPLLVAAVAYFVLELRARRGTGESAAPETAR